MNPNKNISGSLYKSYPQSNRPFNFPFRHVVSTILNIFSINFFFQLKSIIYR